MPYSDNQYLDPIHIVWRKGTPEDPYIDRAEYLKVVNQKIVLSEIPDKLNKVKINGMQEVNIDRITNRSLSPNEFAVNYANGIIQVHSDREAETLNIIYKGRGFIQYPSNRIYHQDEYNNILRSLDEIINESLDAVEFLKDSIDDKITDYQNIRDVILDKIDDINIATDNAINVTEDAQIATDKALDAYETNRLVFKPYVNTHPEIAYKYPSPEIGWTTQVYETGIRYRYDGIQWVPIDLFGGNIPLADHDTDGLMSSAVYNQVQTIEGDLDNLEDYVSELETRTTTKTIVFCYPYLVNGENSIIARFPHKGTIKSIRGICSKSGADVMTEIIIEKSVDLKNWISILDANKFLTFDVNSNFDNGKHVVIANNVNENDMFRINVRTLSQYIEGVTIEIAIEI
jgi:hypothetical protein